MICIYNFIDILYKISCCVSLQQYYETHFPFFVPAALCTNLYFLLLIEGKILTESHQIFSWNNVLTVAMPRYNFTLIPFVMQDASLQGSPESPKSIVLVTGEGEYNMVSLHKTIRVYLMEMGSPFLPCKTRSGRFVAKSYSLKMWLKDSPFCMDLELKDAPALPT